LRVIFFFVVELSLMLGALGLAAGIREGRATAALAIKAEIRIMANPTIRDL
jgi:hypothetical protein